MTRVRQTKQQKAEYDRKRKAEVRKERRLTKPMKLFFKNKYTALYDEFMEFYNQMDNKYPEKKDLTKTQMFKDFLKSYSAANNPVETSTETSSVNISAAINPAETSSVNISAANNPAETSSVNISAANNPAETSSVNISAANNPAETSSVNISAAINPAETSSV